MELTLDEQQYSSNHFAVCGVTRSGKWCVTELLGSAWFSVHPVEHFIIL